MQLYDEPKSLYEIGLRTKGLAANTMRFLPSTVSWFATRAPLQPRDVYQRRHQSALNEVSSYVAQRESFAGTGGALYQARSRVLAIEDPYIRTQGLMVIDNLQKMPFTQQQAVIQWLQGRTGVDTAAGQVATPEQIAQAQQTPGQVESAFLDGAVSVEGNTLNITGTKGRTDEGLYQALALAFPGANLNLDDQAIYGTANTILTDLSEAFMEPAMKSASFERLATGIDQITNPAPDQSFWDPVKNITLGASGVGSDYLWPGLGTVGRKVGLGGLVDDVAAVSAGGEQFLSDTLVGYYDPSIGANVPGLLNWNLEEDLAKQHPEWSQEELMSAVDQQTQNRADAFGMVSLVAGALGLPVIGSVGTRIKHIRSLTNLTSLGDEAYKTLPTNIKPRGGTGTLDRAFEVYRRPLRAAQEAFDRKAIQMFAVSPDKFFHETMFGSLYESGGKQLISVLQEAKRVHPGTSDRAIMAQVAFVKESLRADGIAGDLVEGMLRAGSTEDARKFFVDYATHPQGEFEVKKLMRQKAAQERRVAELSDIVAHGEDGVLWNKDLARYNELNSPEAIALRDAAMSPQTEGGTGMDASNWADLPESERQIKIKAVNEEAELAAIRKRLGFEPTSTDRFGRDFTPATEPPRPGEPRYNRVLEPGTGEAPRPDLPAEGTVVMMPTSEVSNLADPTLWDPTTSQNVPQLATPAEPRVHQLTNINMSPEEAAVVRQQRLDTYAKSEDEAFAYHWGPAGEIDSFARDGVWPNTPADAAVPGAGGSSAFPNASYWGATGEEAYNLLPMKSARDSMLLRTPRSKVSPSPSGFGEEFVSKTPIDSSFIDYLGADGEWHTARSVSAPQPAGVSHDVAEAAAMNTREAIRNFSTFEKYPNLEENSTIVREVTDWTGSVDEAAHILQSAEDLGGGLKRVDAFSSGDEFGKRFYYVENPDGRLGAMMTTDIRKYANGDVQEAFNNISLKAARGTAGRGRELLEGLMKYADPTPEELLDILKSNSISRKSAIAVHRLLKQLVAERTQKVGKLTLKEYNRLKADISANGIREPLEISVNPTTGEAIASEGFHRWLIAKELGIEEVPVKIDFDPSVKGQPFLKAAARPTPNPADVAKLARERLKLASIEERLSHTSTDLPQMTYPTRSVVRAVVRAPVTRSEKLLSNMLRLAHAGPGQFFDLAKFVDELPSRPKLYVPGNKDNPVDWLDKNTATLSNTLRRAGVPPKELQDALGQLMSQKTPQSFYEVLENEIFGDGGLVDRHLRPDTPPDLRQKIITLHGRTPETRTRSVLRTTTEVGGGRTGVNRPVLGVQKGNELIPIPSRPTEFLREVALPNVDDLIEATSIVRRAVRNAEKRGVGKVNAAAPYNIARLLLHMQTATLKPLVMVARLPAMGMRIQLEQSLRMAAGGYRPIKGLPDGLTLFPGGIPMPFTKRAAAMLTGAELPGNIRVLSNMFGEEGWRLIDPDPRFKGLSQLPPNPELGGMLDENTDHGSVETTAVGTEELRNDPARIKTVHTESHRKELEMAHTDWLDRHIAGSMDREEVKNWLQTTHRGQSFMETEMRPQLERTTIFETDGLDAAVNKWLDDRIEYINQITKGEKDLMDYIATGELRQLGSTDDVARFDASGNIISERYVTLRSDINNLHATLNERRMDLFSKDINTRAEYHALAATLKKREEKMARLVDEYGSDLGIGTIKAGDKRAFRAELKRRWTENPDTIPDRIMLEHGGFNRNPELGLREDMHRWASASSEFMYRPFKALSYADRHGTRGSLWTQAYEREFDRYIKYGYSTPQAKALAYADAGNITRDLMYDLNARTSVQRSLKDLFWFAPATQEVMYTWLVKIPSRSYWPLGIASLYAKAKLGIFMMKKLGIVGEDSKGEDVLHVPGLSHVVEMVSGGRVKVPDIAYGKLTGLNLVTTGGGVPGLSTGGNFALGRAALKWGGPFKAMSDVFQPYGPEASLLPAPVVYLHEAIFGEAPPFEPLSHDYQKAQWDRSFDQGIQYAYHDLADQGIKPPRIEDFGTADADGHVTLTSAEEEKYKKAAANYLDQLRESSTDYAQGIAWVRFIGSTVAPMSLYTTSKDREAWDKFWDELTGTNQPGSTLSPDQQGKLNNWLSDHPNSLAFSVFTTKYGTKKKDLPFAESLDDGIFDAYYTGEASTLSPEEFSAKLMATESRRFYQAKLDKALHDISPTMDPWELLRNSAARTGAITTYQEEWQRFLYLNPKSADLINQQNTVWAESGQYPVKSFEAERMATTLGLLKQITPMLTGQDGIRPEELRTVQGQLSALYSDTGQFPPPQGKTAKAMGWWYENVLSPYLDKTTDLYDQAENLQTRGLDATKIYDQIRELSNTPPPSYKGQTVPTVEEYFWGNKTEAEQQATKITWASRPITWLTDFQRDQAGYTITPTGATFLEQAAQFDTWFNDQLQARDISPQSKEWDQWQKWREAQLSKAAEKAGPEAVNLLALNEAAPIQRIAATGYGSGNTQWANVVNAAKYVSDTLTHEGYSPKSYSERALQLKTWFYTTLNNLAASDPSIAQLLSDLSKSFPLDGGGDRQGVVLYEAVFFGNFNESYIPQDLAALGG